jgi:hypothetical protein
MAIRREVPVKIKDIVMHRDNPKQGEEAMTSFTKQNLIVEGKYLTYMPNGYDTPWNDRRFVARFKYGAGIGSFATCLRKNFTVEEYFARMDAGESPLPIAQSKGYLLPHIKKWIKKAGYPVTMAGYEEWWTAKMADMDADAEHDAKHAQRSA